MLPEAIQKALDKNSHQFDQRLEAERRQADQRCALMEKRIESDIAEARNARRWMTGVIITCTLALAGYLSALLHMSH